MFYGCFRFEACFSGVRFGNLGRMLIFGWVEGGGSVVGASFRIYFGCGVWGFPAVVLAIFALVLWVVFTQKRRMLASISMPYLDTKLLAYSHVL